MADSTRYPLNRERINPALKTQVAEQIARIFPIQSQDNKTVLRSEGIEIDDSKFDPSDLKAHQNARQTGKTWGASIKAKLVLERDGKVVQRNTVRLGTLPLMTDLGTFQVGGNDWFTPLAQLRLKPGAYTREKTNGEFETFIPMKGASMSVWMDPAKGILKIGHRTTNVDWYPIVRALGATDQQIRDALGGDRRAAELVEINSKAKDEKNIDKLYASLIEEKQNANLVKSRVLEDTSEVGNLDRSAKISAIKDWMSGTSLDPFVTKKTLGAAIDKVGIDLLLKSAGRILSVQRGDAEPDDRDAPYFKTAHGVEDLMGERIQRLTRMFTRDVMKNLATGKTIGEIVPNNMVDAATVGYFGGMRGIEGGLAHTAEAANPLAILSEQSKLTLMGQGGIQSDHAITMGARLMRPSAVNFVDPVRTPEGCFDEETEVYTATGWIRWAAVTPDTELACMADDGQLSYRKPLKLISYHYNGPMIGYHSDSLDLLVTPDHRMWVRPQDRGAAYRFVAAKDLLGTNRNVRCGGHRPLPGSRKYFVLPTVEAKNKHIQKPGNPPIGAHLNPPAPALNPVAWCRFLGWYLSEGHAQTHTHCVTLTQLHSSKAECQEIEETLNALPFTWHKGGDRRFHISGKQLAVYCRQFGKSGDKFIPAEVFAAPVAARLAFAKAAFMGDGRKRNKSKPARGTNPLGRWICYCTKSARLANDMYRLLFELGINSSISFEPDTRKPEYVGCYTVQVHSHEERQLTSKNHRHPAGLFFTQDYDGIVYCAEVPGGRMYVKRKDGFGFWCGNSNIGVVTHAASNTIREDKTLKSLFYPVKNGKVDTKNPVYLSTEEAAQKVIGYPDEWDLTTGTTKDDHVRAVRDDEIVDVKPTEVQYLIPSGASAFDHTSNAALFLSNTHANRAMMAGKHLTQALPLVNREAPKVTLTDASGNDVHARLARTFTIRAKVDGVVEAVSPSEITIAGVKHALFDRYPMQAKVSLTHEPVVKVGDRVKKGDLIADSNYSKDGRLALGVHLRSMYSPWRNASNYEDAIVISESAAKKLTSEHLHRLDLQTTDDTKLDPKLFVAQFPTRLTTTNLAKLDDSGVVKKGQKIQPGDVLIAAARKRKFETLDRSAKNLGDIHKSLLRPYVDAALVWDEDFPAEVVRVLRLPDHIEVHLRTEEPMQVGDKLSMSSAAKGTVSEIIPDDRMPRDKAGKHMEIIFNPHGVAGRINPSQTIEQAALKLAIDKGEKITHAAFDNVDHASEVLKKLKAAGLTHAEKLFDPVTGKDIERPVATGYNYVSKLDHPVRKKFSARGRDGYTVDEAPTSGKGRGGQSYDQLTTYALLGHNAHAILGESVGIRGTKNDDFWRAYQAGETPPPPKVPLVFEKFRNYLNAAGVDTKQHGNTLQFLPMTDKRVLQMSNGEVLNARQVRAKDLAEEKGGLFDPGTTGGLFGEKWTHIPLSESIPHPLYEKVIRDVTGIKQAEFLGLIGHTLYYDQNDKKFYPEPGKGRLTGEQAFKALLSFDIGEKLADVSKRITTAVGSDRNRLHRTSLYLRGLQSTKMNPFEAYMTSNVPVIPPKFRGVMEQSHGGIRVADANTLYRDLIMTRDVLKDGESNGTLPQSELAKARVSVYDALAATVGVGVPLTERRDKQELAGFVNIIKGKSNKEGLFQRQLARRRNDFTGRSTIEPDANLGVDEIGIPEEMAWKIYEPAVVRRLSLNGWAPADAAKQVRDRTLAARNALDAEMAQRMVLYNRAPSLHRLSINAAAPRITPGKEIKISPMVLGPLNADFDGDTVSVHVPITEDARREAFNLLPSRNLIYDRDKSLAFGPEKDVIAGVFALTRDGVNSGLEFDSPQAAIQAFKNNQPSSLRMNSTVRIKGLSGAPTIGQLIFKSIVPERFFAGVTFPIDRKKMEAILTRIAKEAPQDFNRISRMLTQSGFEAVAQAGGFTATVDELSMDRTKVRRLLDQFETKVQQGKTLEAKRDIAMKFYNDTVKPELRAALKEHLDKHPIGYRDIMESGSSSKANYDQFQQIFMSPVLVNDVNDKLVPSVIKSSYGGGMRLSDYVMTLPGARAGIVARSLSTALPGFLAKELAGNVAPTRITEVDCNTQKGIEIKLAGTEHDVDIIDRHLLKAIPGTTFKRNDPVTPAMLAQLRDKKVPSLWARSALTCASTSPPCQMCAGRSGDGKLWQVGANIGINYGQAVSERSTQLTMRAFHSGGTVGAGHSLTAGFQRLRELLAAPDVVRNQGTIAQVSGRVTQLRPAPQGGYNVTIGTTEQYIPSGRTPKVKLGDTVEAGDPLSDGSFRPQDIAATKGLLPAQQYVVNQARSAYQTAGATVRKPVLEVVVASTMRQMEVTDAGGEPDLVPGDIIHENDYLNRHGRNSKLKAVPYVPGLSSKPLATSTDLLERLNFQRLEDSLREIPARGGISDLTGSRSPIPGLAYGAAFRPESQPFTIKKAERLAPVIFNEDDDYA